MRQPDEVPLMRLDVFETVWIARPREEVFEFTNDVENMTSFVGFGPIPGIVSAAWREGAAARLGAVRDVRKTDGTVHVEELEIFEAPGRHRARISGLGPPLSLLIREVHDDFVLEAEGGGTRLDRTFSAELRSPLALPLALALRPLLRQALRRDLGNIKHRMEKESA